MAIPAPEPLFEHLSALRDAADPHHPSHDRRWREVARWLAAAYPEQHPEAEDARQEALVSLLRGVRRMRAEEPLQAAKWVLTIVRRKRVDGVRVRASDPVHQALRTEPRGDAPPPLERVAAGKSLERDAEHLQALVALVLEHVQAMLDETVPNPTKRLLRANQARAALLRLVFDEDAEAIASALGYTEPLSRDRVYKWVERGRPVVTAGLARWEEHLDEAEREEALPVLTTLREIMLQRRSDAGVPRLDRRKDEKS